MFHSSISLKYNEFMNNNCSIGFWDASRQATNGCLGDPTFLWRNVKTGATFLCCYYHHKKILAQDFNAEDYTVNGDEIIEIEIEI